MPGRVELDLVDPVSETVVRVQYGLVAIGVHCPFGDLGRAATLPERVQLVVAPRTAFSSDSVGEDRIVGVGVVVDEWLGLVDDFVRRHETTVTTSPGRSRSTAHDGFVPDSRS